MTSLSGKEANEMAKDNIPTSPGTPASGTSPAATVASAAAPLFALARTVLDEMDRESERWIEYGMAQSREAAEVARTLRNQSVGISRTMLGTLEHTTSSVLDAAQSYAKPFLKVGA
jgi:hypothetical protein